MLVIGSRGSKLALWQANHIKDELEALGEECRIEIITTSGDRFQSGPLKEIGTKGLFTKEIEDALLEGRIDVAVHSLKDMPTEIPDGLQITADRLPAYIDQHQVPYPSVFDPSNQIAVSYGLFSPPDTLFFDANGSLVKTVPGQISREDLNENLQAIAG